MTEGVSLREFGRLVGVSGEAIRKAIKTGRIPASLVGEAALSSGRKVPIIADVDAARAAFAGNTNPSHRPPTAKVRTQKAIANAAAADQRAAAANPASIDRAADPEEEGDDVPSIATSRAITEAYKAKITKLEFREKAGKLVDAEDFRSKFATMVTTARTRLLGVPSKAKGRIPHLTVDEIAVLSELVREALEEVVLAR